MNSTFLRNISGKYKKSVLLKPGVAAGVILGIYFVYSRVQTKPTPVLQSSTIQTVASTKTENALKAAKIQQIQKSQNSIAIIQVQLNKCTNLLAQKSGTTDGRQSTVYTALNFRDMQQMSLGALEKLVKSLSSDIDLIQHRLDDCSSTLAKVDIENSRQASALVEQHNALLSSSRKYYDVVTECERQRESIESQAAEKRAQSFKRTIASFDYPNSELKALPLQELQSLVSMMNSFDRQLKSEAVQCQQENLEEKSLEKIGTSI